MERDEAKMILKRWAIGGLLSLCLIGFAAPTLLGVFNLIPVSEIYARAKRGALIVKTEVKQAVKEVLRERH